jgi:hypothetical protein
MSTICFVVLTHDEEATIARRLWALRNQDLAGSSVETVQIIVVDRQSSDRTLLVSVPFVDGIAVCGSDLEGQWDLGRRIAPDGAVLVRIDPDTEITPWMAAEAADRADRERWALPA